MWSHVQDNFVAWYEYKHTVVDACCDTNATHWISNIYNFFYIKLNVYETQ